MFEGLLRWRHPQRGLLELAAFIPVADETSLIVPIGRWVIEEACRRARPEPSSGRRPARRGREPLGAWPRRPRARELRAHAVRESDVTPSALRLELTETTLFEEVEDPAAVLGPCALGVLLVLDDFGTGFSRLSYLSACPSQASSSTARSSST